MNIDLVSSFEFGNVQALRSFMLDHRFIHEQTAAALTSRFNVAVGSFGISSQSADEAWSAMMTAGEKTPVPQVLSDWLKFHADIHVQSYTLLGQSPTTAPDLSVVNFSSATEFYDWMYVHQQMHDFEQQQLGLT